MLIAFSGLKGSGKDTAAKVLIEEFGFTKVCFADALREALLILDPIVPVQVSTGSVIHPPEYRYRRLSLLVEQSGWDVVKRHHDEVRRLMQTFGTEVGRGLLGDDVWIEALFTKYPNIGEDDVNYVITDCRFDNEVKFVHLRGGDVCWVERPGLMSDGHASENPALKGKADYILHNDDTIEELQEDVRFMMFMKGAEHVESGVTG